ncbi:MAG TPA: PBP1A family penicillin-binding protein [Gemmatimonadaceae bacterium]|nr:PBP1A family penicillin-binding protein [Gemmatimonadaceae bacterium]
MNDSIAARRAPASGRARALAFAALVLAAPAVGAQGTGDPWRIIPLPQSSQLFARDGSLIGELGKEWRTSISIRTLPKYVGQAFIAVEDKRFYQHDGVDVVGIAGALKDAVTGDVRGASTITQLVVGNMHPDVIDRRDRSLGRKLREQQAAREMEKHYTKEQILEAFLNLIPFGHGWNGIESASRHYFGKPAAKLTLAEAATLAALPKGPSIYDPIRHPDRARERRDLVLSLMAEQGYISRSQAAAAKREPIVTAPDAGFSVRAPYFVDYVKRELERAGVPVEQGGFRIHTSLDPQLQQSAAEALSAGAARVEARPGYRHRVFANRAKGSTDYLQGMVVALDPRSGDVLAMVGGRDYGESQFNRAVNATRQPGSTFKPFVYAAAVAGGIPANEVIPDTALAIPLDNGALYRPDNADNLFLGALTMREALAKSRNSVAVQLGQRVGMDSVIGLARRLGIGTPISPYPSSAIGASAVRPLDFVAAFAPFANLGSAVEPRVVLRVDDRSGRAVYTAPATAHHVLDPQVAFIVQSMMRDVVEHGTATVVRRTVPERIPVAGKTGTPNDNTDVWFVGMTPELVAGVWLGFDRPKTITPGAAGGSLAAPVWAEMVAKWYEGRPAGEWTPPEGLITAEMDRASGELATVDTPPERRYTEYFIPGTEPGAIRPNTWRVFTAGPILP